MSVFTLALVQFLFVAVDGRVMRWVPNTDYDNPANWPAGRLPCRNDRVRFPSNVAASVFVQRNSTVMEIILPNDGEVILGDGASFYFSSSAASIVDATCPGKEIVFSGSTPQTWFSPDNWCEMSDIDSDRCLQEQPRRLDTESIPCSYDDVIFPFPSRFIVDISSGVNIAISSLHVGAEQFTQRQWRQFLDTDIGRRQFVKQSPGVATTFSMNSQMSCNDVTGCLCNNEQLTDKICETRRSSCLQPGCANALSPHGHCCQICGAVVSLEYGSGFRIAAIDNVLKNLYQPPVTKRSAPNEHVTWIVSKMDRGTHEQIQVIIFDNGDGESAVKVAYRLKEELQKDMKGRRRYHITHIEMQTSGTAESEAHGHTGDDTSSTSTSAGIIVAIIVALLLISAIIVAYFMCRGQQQRRMMISRLNILTFARWRSGSEGAMELDNRVSRPTIFDNRIYDERTNFENMNFENVLAVSQPPFDDLEVQPTAHGQGEYANPLYGDEAGVQEVLSQIASKPDPSPRDSGDNNPQHSPSISSKVAHVWRGLKATTLSGRQRLDNEDDDAGDTDGVKGHEPSERQTSAVREEDDEREDSATEIVEKKKKRGKKTKREVSGDKHQRLEEESDDNESSGKSWKKSIKTRISKANDEGFANPCYYTPEETQGQLTSQQPVEPVYRTGFSNPVFESQRAEDAD